MILKFYDLKKELNKKINFYLLYGNNRGLIEEVIDKTLKPNFSKNIIYYDESEILSNFEVFKEQILNKSFFDNDKLIVISRCSDKIFKPIEEIIDKNIDDLKIILKSGALEKKSKLRKFFEKSSDTIIVPFYEDNNQSLMYIAQKFFKDKEIKISAQNINLIIERSKGDRLNLKNELEKIFNFCLNKQSITTEEIQKLTNLAENYDISEMVDQCLAKSERKTLNILNENNLATEENILVLKTFLFKLKRLKKLKLELGTKKNLDTVISSHKPPIFWKDKDLIKKQMSMWSYDQIKNLINNVNDLELLIKKNSQISNYLTNDFILEKLHVSNN